MFLNKKIIISGVVATILFTGCSIKPEAIKSNEIKEDVKKTMEVLNKVEQPVTKPISLDEAIQRAINHNLSKKVELLNTALANQKIDIVAYEALPSLTAKAGYTQRDNYAASASASFTDGKPVLANPPSYSVSQDKENANSSIGFSWNILDFGVSYVRANQQANRYLIAKEKERKAIHNIKQDVRNAYFQAVSADELLKSVKPILNETKKAFEDSKAIAKAGLEKPIKSLTYQRELLEVIRSLNTLEENLIKSKIELSRLMGLKPGTNFELAEKIKENYELPQINVSIDTLEKTALENRPELAETRYQEKISQDEVKAVMLKMLPGINLNAGYNYENSEYLLNNEWINYGASISWNLLSIFNVNLNRKLAKTQIELAKQQKLALSMAVISQVHISMLDFNQSKKEYYLSSEYFKVAKEIFNIIQNENALDVNGQLSLIKEKLNYLIANLRLSSSYAKVQNSYGKVISSVGNEIIFNEVKKETITPKIKMTEVKEEPKVEIVEEKQEVKTETIVQEEIKEELVASEITLQGIVLEDSNLREINNLNSSVIRVLKKDEEIKIEKKVHENGTWYKTVDGYISAELIKIIK